MNRRIAVLSAVVAVALAFFAGWYAGARRVPAAGPARPVLYWVDPMNPSFRSPEPGIAPCGMPLEPVYADGTGSAPAPGVIVVPAERRRLVGIETEPVSIGPVSSALRLFGRVAADEARVHVVTSKLAGSVRRVGAAARGGMVRAGERLGEFTSDATSVSQRSYLTALEEIDELRAQGLEDDPKLVQFKSSARVARQNLLNHGLTEAQVDEIARTRTASTAIELRSPVTGYVLEREFAVGQQIDGTTPLFVIADISRVWIWADVFGTDADLVRPGARAIVRLPDRPEEFEAKVSGAPSRFDPVARTQSVRLEAANPDQALLPEMLVDVEVPITTEPVLTVPSAAVIDSGLRRRVWIDRGDGGFEPRDVRTGFRIGDRVQILSGLTSGDRVVVAGNFLLDSESRMRSTSEPETHDPVCGMVVDLDRAAAAGSITELDGKKYGFCSPRCKQRFDGDPRAYLESGAAP